MKLRIITKNITEYFDEIIKPILDGIRSTIDLNCQDIKDIRENLNCLNSQIKIFTDKPNKINPEKNGVQLVLLKPQSEDDQEDKMKEFIKIAGERYSKHRATRISKYKFYIEYRKFIKSNFSSENYIGIQDFIRILNENGFVVEQHIRNQKSLYPHDVKLLKLEIVPEAIRYLIETVQYSKKYKDFESLLLKASIVIDRSSIRRNIDVNGVKEIVNQMQIFEPEEPKKYNVILENNYLKQSKTSITENLEFYFHESKKRYEWRTITQILSDCNVLPNNKNQEKINSYSANIRRTFFQNTEWKITLRPFGFEHRCMKRKNSIGIKVYIDEYRREIIQRIN